MRITIDTREDSYQDALGVLRRAYGRHRSQPKTEVSPTPGGAVDLSPGDADAEQPDIRSATRAGHKDTGTRKTSARRTRKSPATRTSATRSAAVRSPVSKSTGKGAAVKKAARSSPSSPRRPGPRKGATPEVAANTAPRGRSETVRAWAREQGMQVSARGRMPARVIAAYREAHKD